MSVVKSRLWASSIAVIAAVGIASSASAQQKSANTTAAADTDANAIVVTAQKRSENVQKVPISIVAVSAVGLTNANVENIADLPRLAPDLSIAKGPQTAYTRISIRGIGAASNTAVEPSVASFVDGVYVPRPGSLLTNFMDMQGVEVLSGPQGTLFGRNASVGAISVQTAQPKHEFSAAVAGEYGTANRQKVEGYINAPLASNVALRIAGMEQSQDGFWHNELDGQTYGGSKDAALRGTVKAEFNNVTWIVRADYAHTTGDGFSNFALDATSVSPAQLATLQSRIGGMPDTSLSDRNTNQVVDGGLNDRQWGVMSDLSLRLGDYKLRLINSYRDWQNNQTDGDVTWMPASLLSRVSGYASKSNNEELQLISPQDKLLGGRLDFVAGLYYFNEDYATSEKFQQGSGLCSLLSDVSPHYGALCNAYYLPNGGANVTDGEFSQTLNSYAGYGQANIRLLDKLKLTVGGRYSQDDKHGSFDQTVAYPLMGVLLRAPEADTLRTSGGRFTERVSLNYTPTRDMLFFANFSTGYKSGGFNSGGSSVASNAAGRTFAPETTNNYELGAKTSWLDRRLTLNLTLFRMDIKNFQDRLVEGTNITVINVPGLRNQGAEFEGAMVVSPLLRFNASVSYLDSKFTNYPDASPLPGTLAVQNLSGKPANFAPKWSGSLGAQLGAPLGHTGLRWQLNGNMTFTSQYFDSTVDDNNPLTLQRAYQLVNARLTLFGRDDRWSLAVFANNLTNTKYGLGTTYQTLGSVLGTGAGAVRVLRADPATVGVGLKVQF